MGILNRTFLFSSTLKTQLFDRGKTVIIEWGRTEIYLMVNYEILTSSTRQKLVTAYPYQI